MSAHDLARLDQLVARFTAEQLTRAMGRLSASGALDATAVHETRKAIKRIRAALKLVQADLGERFSDWNARLRSVNRRLSPTRDFDACQQLIDEFATNAPAADQTVLGLLKAELAAQRGHSLPGAADNTRESLVAELAAVQAGFLAWHPDEAGFGLIRRAVKKMARQGRKLVRQLAHDRTVERMHALRRVVKRRLYWMEILAPIWSEDERDERESVEDLSERLGRHHDLAVLEERLADSAVGTDSKASRDVAGVVNEIGRRREKLEAQSLKRAGKLFAEHPKEFTDRWKHRADEWRKSCGGSTSAAAVRMSTPA